jgi:hypothetical protein
MVERQPRSLKLSRDLDRLDPVDKTLTVLRMVISKDPHEVEGRIRTRLKRLKMDSR